MVGPGQSNKLHGIGYLPDGLYAHYLSRQRVITPGPKKRGDGDQNHAQYFQGAQQAAPLFAGRRQTKTEKEKVDPWVGFLQSVLAMVG